MDWGSLKRRLTPKVRHRTGSFLVPAIAFEIEPGFVAGARLNRTARHVERVAAHEFDAPLFEPLASRSSFPTDSGLHDAITSVVNSLGAGTGNVGVLIPDGAVRVGVLSFETLPSHHDEADELVRWRLKELLPFALDEARISYQFLSREHGNIELLAIAARSSVLGDYEAVLDRMNGGPALILPATMALLPLLPETGGAAQILIHVCSGWVTAVVLIGDRIRLWRNRDLGGAISASLVSDIAREVARVLASTRDHFKTEVERVWTCIRPPLSLDARAELSKLLAREVAPLSVKPDSLAAPGTDRGVYERLGAPFCGLVMNPS